MVLDAFLVMGCLLGMNEYVVLGLDLGYGHCGGGNISTFPGAMELSYGIMNACPENLSQRFGSRQIIGGRAH